MKDNSIVIGLGELLWDVFPDHKKMGGAPANFAYHVSQLGLRSLVVSAVGEDESGSELLDVLDKAGLSYDIQKSSYPTGIVQVTVDEKGIPSYDICEPVAWDFIQMKPDLKSIAQKVSAVCFGLLAQRGKVSRKTIGQILKLVPDEAYKVFDVNLRQHYYTKELIEESLSMCNVLKVNDEELEVLVEMLGVSGSQDEICKNLIDSRQLKMLVLTCGTSGSYLYTTDQKSFQKTPIVEVVDTVGAGDSFTAAIVAGLLRGEKIGLMHENAVRLSAFVCTKNGAMPDYNLGNLEHFIK